MRSRLISFRTSLPLGLFRLDGFEPKEDEDTTLPAPPPLIRSLSRIHASLSASLPASVPSFCSTRSSLRESRRRFVRYNVHQWRSGGLVDSYPAYLGFQRDLFFFCKPLRLRTPCHGLKRSCTLLNGYVPIHSFDICSCPFCHVM